MFTENEIRIIKNLSEQIEKSRTILPEVLELIYEHNLFKVFTPKTLGGLGLSLIDGLKVFQQVGAVDGNIGWAVTIGSGGNMFIPLFEQKVCEERFTHREAVIAGSDKFGIAERVSGGYNISGQWRYCSGADYGTLFTMNCKLQGSDEIVTCSVPRETVEIIPDWNATGLKATSSHSIKVDNIFVKNEETFKFGLIQNQYELPVHSFPFNTFSEASFFSLCLGLTEQFLSEAMQSLELKKERLAIERYQLVLRKCNYNHEQLKSIEIEFYNFVSALWDQHVSGASLQEAELIQFTTFCKEQSEKLVMSAHSLIRYFGMEGVLENTPLNRAWRNLCTASQHVYLTP